MLGTHGGHVGQAITTQGDRDRDVEQHFARIVMRPGRAATAPARWTGQTPDPMIRIASIINSDPDEVANDSPTSSRTNPAAALCFTYGVPSRSRTMRLQQSQ